MVLLSRWPCRAVRTFLAMQRAGQKANVSWLCRVVGRRRGEALERQPWRDSNWRHRTIGRWMEGSIRDAAVGRCLMVGAAPSIKWVLLHIGCACGSCSFHCGEATEEHSRRYHKMQLIGAQIRQRCYRYSQGNRRGNHLAGHGVSAGEHPSWSVLTPYDWGWYNLAANDGADNWRPRCWLAGTNGAGPG